MVFFCPNGPDTDGGRSLQLTALVLGLLAPSITAEHPLSAKSVAAASVGDVHDEIKRSAGDGGKNFDHLG